MKNLKTFLSLILVTFTGVTFSADSSSTKFNCKAKTAGLIHVLTIREKDNAITSFDYLSMQRSEAGQPSASCGIAASSENGKSVWNRSAFKTVVQLNDSVDKEDIATLTSLKNKITLNMENISVGNCGSSVGIATKIRLNKKSKVCEVISEAN